ncbi:putative aminotransferase [Zancudomyces culisetae]|uniref:Putative aminotransferase n=1 Tax=Zancudomyces culisetae TaxID=1213189 RepID=A0A1R1PPH5_ZANCU|nr:putative aminotransferase [Zancudomyces culisetae]OMH82867.1 putative aminotransferase [Zancudomyces culisetae]|eukprot:OMH82431.1 putative aminotransferase [Zancudomyces culisetae]
MEKLMPYDIDEALKVLPVPQIGELPTEFGREMRKAFMLDPEYLPLNHGSYGTTPKYVDEYVTYLAKCAEYNPDKFMRHSIRPLIENSLKRVAPVLGVADHTELVYVFCATAGFNTVIKSLKFEPGDVVLRYNTAYGACYNTISFVKDSGLCEAVDINLNFPCSDQEIIDRTIETIKEVTGSTGNGKRIRLALVDAIGSVPGIVFPFQELAKVFRSHGIPVFLDAAHAIGQIDLDMDNLDVDYMVTNAHKWMYARRGCAIMYVKKELQKDIFPLTISWAYGDNEGFNESFLWQGTIDFSQYLSTCAALNFIEAVGGLKKIQSYCRNLALEAASLLESKYGLVGMCSEQNSHQIAHMINAKLPLEHGNPIHDAVGAGLLDSMLKKKNIIGSFYPHNGAWWVRLSAQIYVSIEDFDIFGKELLESIKEDIATETEKRK